MIKVICALMSVLGILSPFKQVNTGVPVWARFGKDDGVFARVNTEEKVIALTFDDGPHPSLTPKILNILDEYGVKATFFVVGENAEFYPQALKKIALRGHEIGNHTFTHLAESSTNCDKVKEEIIKTEDVIFKLTAKKTFLFRPPTGYCCDSAVKMTKDLGYKTVVWDIDTRDWAHTSPQKILSEVRKYAQNGSIILFHDFIGKDSPTPEALRLVIPWLKSQGYSFLTVGEMMGLEN